MKSARELRALGSIIIISSSSSLELKFSTAHISEHHLRASDRKDVCKSLTIGANRFNVSAWLRLDACVLDNVKPGVEGSHCIKVVPYSWKSKMDYEVLSSLHDVCGTRDCWNLAMWRTGLLNYSNWITTHACLVATRGARPILIQRYLKMMRSRYRTQKCVNGRDCVSVIIPGKSGNFAQIYLVRSECGHHGEILGEWSRFLHGAVNHFVWC